MDIVKYLYEHSLEILLVLCALFITVIAFFNILPKIKQDINYFKIKLYKSIKFSIKFIPWIALGFVIGIVLRYVSMMGFAGDLYKIKHYKIYLRDIMLHYYFTFFFIGLALASIGLAIGEIVYRKGRITIAISTFTGYVIASNIFYDSEIASHGYSGYFVHPLEGFYNIFICSIFAFGGAFIGPMLIHGFIRKKEIINLARAFLIGFAIGFTIGDTLVFSILGLI